MINYLKKRPFYISILVATVLGIIFILTIESCLTYLKIPYENITINNKINFILLFLTAIVVLWYTKETYDLKKDAFKNKWGLLSVDTERTRENTNFIGLKVFPYDSEYKDINIRLFLKNIGQGALKLIEIKPAGYTYTPKVGETKKTELSLTPRGFDDWSGKTLSVQDTIEIDYMFYISKWYEGKVGFSLWVFYEDILGKYKHKINFVDVDLTTYNFQIQDKGKLIEEIKFE